MTTENVLDKSSLRERVARDGRVKVMSFDYCGARYYVVAAELEEQTDDGGYWLLGNDEGPVCGMKAEPGLDRLELEELAAEVLDAVVIFTPNSKWRGDAR